MIKDDISGQFQERIHVSNEGFSSDVYDDDYEVVDVKNHKKTHQNSEFINSIKKKWQEMDTRDRLIIAIY